MRSRAAGKSSVTAISIVVVVLLAAGGVWFVMNPPDKIPADQIPADTGTSGSGPSIDEKGREGVGTDESSPDSGATPRTESPAVEAGGADRGIVSGDGPTPPSNEEGTPASATIVYRGEVADPLGNVIAGVKIASGPFPTANEVVTTTDEKGRFTITLPIDSSPLVRMSHPGYYRQLIELEKSRERDVSYLLFRGGLIRGVVRGPVLVEGGGTENIPTPDVTLEFAGMEGWFDVVKTDAEGRYEVTAPHGPVVITARSALYRDVQILDVEASRTEEVEHDILLVPGLRLEVVLFGVGETVADAHVRVLTDVGLEGEAQSNALGKASFTGLTPGSGKVIVVRSGYRAELHSLVLGENRPLIRRPINLDPSSPWSLDVVDSEGNPRPDAMVRITLDRIELVTAPAGNSKALDILGRDRNYTIDITAPDAPRTRVRFRIPTSGPPKLIVRLPRGGRFTGKVIDRRDHPIAGAGVLITPTGGPSAGQGPPRLTSTALDGTFRTELFAPGPYRVQVHHPQLGRSVVDTRIVDGENRDVGTIQIE